MLLATSRASRKPVASVAAAIVILTQLWLVATGNFAWLNVITIVLAFSAVSVVFLFFLQLFGNERN